MKAKWNDQVIAEADKADLIYIEGRLYFPPNSVKQVYLKKSDTPSVCPWRGTCQYFDIVEANKVQRDAAWSYPEPKKGSLDIVKKDFANYVAFGPDVQVGE